ncbi:MAG: glutamine synthetase [Hamadaea sp.]|nr:glutamine synthetase [Hamadaea sp.]
MSSVLDAATRTAQRELARGVAAALADRGVRAVALTWVDNSGITRMKGVPVRRLDSAAAWGAGASPVFDTFLFDDATVMAQHAGGPVGDLRLHPDLRRLTVLAAQPGWAWAPADRYTQDGERHPQDARATCRAQADRLAARGYAVRAGFEVEWCVSAGPGDVFVPATAGPAYGMTRVVELSDYLRDLLAAFDAQEVDVLQVHPEYAAGQFEVSVAPEDPVGAADTTVLVRETIRAVSVRHGLRATFAPKVVAGGVGNGGHVHVSLWRDGVNVMAGGPGAAGMTGDGEAFAAGILRRLPALLTLGAPSVASYLRLIPSHWAGAYACWGVENREAALRFVPGPAGDRESAANLEIKCFDAAANPYLALAGLLAAGAAGISAEAQLPPLVDVDPATVDGVPRLPTTLADAVAAFSADDVLNAALGDQLADTIVAVRRGEVARLADASAAEIVARTLWRY